MKRIECVICQTPLVGAYPYLCKRCGHAFDKACDSVDMITVIEWVAKRVRRLDAKRHPTTGRFSIAVATHGVPAAASLSRALTPAAQRRGERRSR